MCNCNRRSRRCNSSCNPNSNCGICSVEQGLKDIENAANLINDALDALDEGNFCEAVKNLEDALACLKSGLRNLLLGLDNTNFRIRCGSKREMEDALCDINECISDIEDAITFICNGNICVGRTLIEECLCNLEEAIEDLKDIIGLDNQCKKCNRINLRNQLNLGDQYRS